jgi:hypothetical protein
MAKAHYFIEIKKFTSLHGSELLTDGDLTNRKLAERTLFSEVTHHISDPNMLVLLCQKAEPVQRVLAAKYRPDKHVTLEPAFFGL